MSDMIKVKCFNGQTYQLTVDASAGTVAHLQAEISTASGIGTERQTLLFKGQVLDAAQPLSVYSLDAGCTVNVVRRVGKAPAPAPRPAPVSVPEAAGAAEAAAPAEVPASLDDMMRSMNVGAGGVGAPPRAGGAGGMPDLSALLQQMGGGAGGGGMPDLSSLMAGTGGAGAAGGAGGAAGMEQMLAQLPQMMNGLLNTPMLQEYLNNPEKQEASRDALLNNPMLKGLLESDPEFSKIVNDKEKWKSSMDAARGLFDAQGAAGAGAGQASRDIGSAPAAATPKRPGVADIAPPGMNMPKLSESYGHALGQALINSGLGLDTDLVLKGLKSAVNGEGFPMPLPEYERAMAELQVIANGFLSKANLEDANTFFQELAREDAAVVLEEGKVAYERTDMEPDASQPAAEMESTVLVIVTARLLDGRHFFTCPAADESGETVHPLTLPLATAPPALAKGIVGMRENESRLLYVHPTVSEGMTDMFGDMLPPNALLIFDLQLVSASAPEEEEAAAV